MAKIISFVVLVIILLLVGGLFLDVMGSFLVPLFLALLLAVMFRPLYHWFCARCGRHDPRAGRRSPAKSFQSTAC